MGSVGRTSARQVGLKADLHNTGPVGQASTQQENCPVGRSSGRQVGLKAKLNEAGIPTAVHYPIPLNKQPAVADKNVQLPIGDAVAEKVMSLPMHPYMTEADQQKVVLSIMND